jgi:outer membrane murein-binding lipoprotein Lpp
MSKATQAFRRSGNSVARDESASDWRGNVREAGGTTVITIQPDDPFQSLFMPSFDPGQVATRRASFATSSPIQAGSKAQTFAAPELERRLSDPVLTQRSAPESILDREYVGRDDYRRAKIGARDAWTAVFLMGMFIAGGIYWSVDRINSDETKIDNLSAQVDGLNQQLGSERGVVMARNAEIKQLNEQIDADRKLLSNAKKR